MRHVPLLDETGRYIGTVVRDRYADGHIHLELALTDEALEQYWNWEPAHLALCWEWRKSES